MAYVIQCINVYFNILDLRAKDSGIYKWLKSDVLLTVQAFTGRKLLNNALKFKPVWPPNCPQCTDEKMAAR